MGGIENTSSQYIVHKILRYHDIYGAMGYGNVYIKEVNNQVLETHL